LNITWTLQDKTPHKSTLTPFPSSNTKRDAFDRYFELIQKSGITAATVNKSLRHLEMLDIARDIMNRSAGPPGH